MGHIILTALIIVLTLAAIAYVAERWLGFGPSANDNKGPPIYALLPGDIKYESPSGNFKFYLPITTSIVVSIVLSLVLRIFG